MLTSQTRVLGTIQGIALIVLSTIAWGSGGLFVRLLPFDMWTIVFWRGVFGSVFIGIYVLWRFGGATPGTIRRMGAAGVLITLCSTATITLFVPAFQHTSVANAMTIYAALPFFTAAIAWIWLRERPSTRTMVASLVVIIGIIVMLGPSSGGPNLGDLFAGGATAAMALFTVAIRRSRHVEMLPVAALSTILSLLIALPLAQHLLDLTTRRLHCCGGIRARPDDTRADALRHRFGHDPGHPVGSDWDHGGADRRALGLGRGRRSSGEQTTFVGGAIVLSGVFGRLLLEQREARLRSNSAVEH